jgi:hypothetical protein
MGALIGQFVACKRGRGTDRASNGPEAVQAVAAFRPGVALLDVGLPK